MTKQQRHLLSINPHLLQLDTLPDGDLLILDKLPTRLTDEGYIRTSYILTLTGRVQDIPFHYQTKQHTQEDRHANVAREHATR